MTKQAKKAKIFKFLSVRGCRMLMPSLVTVGHVEHY